MDLTTTPPLRKKIKVVISDLHLGRGRILPNGVVNGLEEFYYGEKLVEFIQYYSSGAFSDYQVELIINGDFLNFLQVDFRGHFLTVFTESVCVEILESILSGHPKVFLAMKEFAAKEDNSITYVMGNHDQAMLWPGCRERMNQALQTQVRYKNLVYFFDGVHIEHGHMQEAANRFDPRKFFLKKNLAEPILNLPFGSHFFIELVLSIKRQFPFVDKIRPFSKMIRWFIFNEFWVSMHALWEFQKYFFRAAFVKDPRKQLSLRKILQILFEAAIFPDLTSSAENMLEDDRIHTVIYGHSHVCQYKQFSVDKEYLNTGTWTEITSLDIVSMGKMTKLTYVFIEYPTEGTGRPRARLKEWNGYYRIEQDLAVS